MPEPLFTSPAGLAREEKERAEAILAAETINISPVSTLAAYLRGKLDKAKRAKEQYIQWEMLECIRSKNMEYTDDIKAKLIAANSSTIYMGILAQKIRDAKAWTFDIFESAGDRPWSLEPTPIADIPQSELSRIEQQVLNTVFQGAMLYAQQTGNMVSPDEFNKVAAQHAEEIHDETALKIQEAAKKKASRMAVKIDDQLVEGGWKQAWEEFIDDFYTFHFAIMSVPVIRKRPVKVWKEVNGVFEEAIETKIVVDMERESPLDVYWDADSTEIDDGGLYVRKRLSRMDLTQYLTVPGWSDNTIIKVLSDFKGSGFREWFNLDTEKERLQHKNNTSMTDSEKIDVVRCWVNVPGSILLEWGMDETKITNPAIEYPIEAWICADNVLKAIINPDRLGKKPYIKACWDSQAGSFAGKPLYHKVKNIEDGCNSLSRAIFNNAGYSSGPISEINVDRVEGSDYQVTPWKTYLVTNKQMKEEPAVRFTNIPFISRQLIEIFDKYKVEADIVSGIPTYVQKMPRETASGYAMHLQAAAKGMKYGIIQLDAVIAGTITKLFDYNMKYSDDPLIKGDLRIKSRGSSALIIKDQMILRRNEFMQMLMPFMQMFPPEIMLTLLKSQADLLDLDDVVDLLKKMDGSKINFNMPPANAPPPPSAKKMLPGGMAEQGGAAANLTGGV